MTGVALLQEGMASFSQAATGSLVAAVWQGALLAGAAWMGLRLLPKTPAAVRFAIWFGVFLAVTSLPVIAVWPHAAVAGHGSGQSAWLTVDARWSLAIAAVWALASLWRAGQLVVAGFRVRALWKRAKPVAGGGASGLRPTHRGEAAMNGAPGLLNGARERYRAAQLCVSEEVDRPTVIGFFAPKILIPGWLLEKLTPAELEQVVLHESGHLGRADDWMNLLQKLALVAFPLNPALAWVERRLCFERELACDERVLRATGAPKAYAACLATLADYRLQQRGLTSGLALALGVLGRESELGRRVGRILRRGEGMKPWHAKLVLGSAMLGLLAAATCLEHCPQLIGFSQAGQHASLAVTAPVPKLRDGYRYQSVVFHPDEARANGWKSVGDASTSLLKSHYNSSIATLVKVKHEANGENASVTSPKLTLTAAAEGPRNSGEGFMARTRAVPAVAKDSRSQSGTDAATDNVTQWIVVRSWQDAEGSRMVLTTAEVSTGRPAVSTDMQAAPSKEFHPYAAVPVRGGWLVFQL
jgi:Zn-dependent protease with chaperone function